MSAAADIEYVGGGMEASEARALTDQIKTGVEAVWQLITRAYTERAWSVLGYTSWDDYCTREFGASRLRLPREERAEVVSSLRESGLSIRAIASATGDPVMTVQNELARGVRNRTPEVDEDALAEELIASAPVTGLDGKTYQPSRPVPKPSEKKPTEPRRRPLTDAAREIGLDLKNITARMERLLADDRFARNKGEVAPHLRHYLAEAIKVCQDLNRQLT